MENPIAVRVTKNIDNEILNLKNKLNELLKSSTNSKDENIQKEIEKTIQELKTVEESKRVLKIMCQNYVDTNGFNGTYTKRIIMDNKFVDSIVSEAKKLIKENKSDITINEHNLIVALNENFIERMKQPSQEDYTEQGTEK